IGRLYRDKFAFPLGCSSFRTYPVRSNAIRCPDRYHCTVFAPEITMPKVSLLGMSVEALMDLRKRVDEMLLNRRAELEKQLEKMGKAVAVVGSRRVARGGGSPLRGKKVPPKYRGPSGETWAGRGARPLWLVAAIKGAKKLGDFLIDKSARKGR